ncbi:MAG: SDR family oxidoreductase [Ruminococcaceae bacterium]|nr:SDR family oxidoreductase [Oscillospiraceae bacterium]
MRFKEKTAFVTGAAKGIGKATAIGLAKGGANVILADIQDTTETYEEVKQYTDRVMQIKLDISVEEDARKAIYDALSEFGKVDILINNAAIFPIADFLNSTSEQWKKVIDVNVLGTMYLSHAVLPSMIENHYGRIVNVGSVAGVYGLSWFVDYSMSKGAVISFTKALAKAVSSKGITVNCVSPGSVVPAGSENLEEVKNFSFIGRGGTHEEMANVILFVASDEASYISGQNYLVDGCRKQM